MTLIINTRCGRDFHAHDRLRPAGRRLGFTQDTGNEIIERGVADVVSFGAPFIGNPDLVERFAQGPPLAESDRSTYYAGRTEGYTDYPTVARV